jgi:hypothetical protein
MVQLDALLSQFVGVISGFELGGGVDPRGSNGGGPANVDGGGHILSLACSGSMRPLSAPARTARPAP